MTRHSREIREALLIAGLIVLLAGFALALAATVGCAHTPSPGTPPNDPTSAPPRGWEPGPYSPAGGNESNPNTAEGRGDGRTVQPLSGVPAWVTDARLAIGEALALVDAGSVAETELRAALLALDEPSASRADQHLARAVLAAREGGLAVRRAKAIVGRELVRLEMEGGR